ncbi:MAG: class I SAM-dependent methyltransferase [Myxococcota bacterium]
MSTFDREKWERRYTEGRGYHAEPDPFLDEVADLLPVRGRALDLAGGVGRHARWLARRGLDVTLADISPAALAEAGRRAADEGLALETLEIDLDEAFPDGPWDLVLVSFFLVRAHFARIVASLAPGGKLVLVHPTSRNLERHAKPSAEWLLEPGELDAGVPGLTTRFHDEGWTARGRHEVHYVGEK